MPAGRQLSQTRAGLARLLQMLPGPVVSGIPSNGSQGWGGPGWGPLSPLTQSSSWAGLLSFLQVSRFLSSWGTPWVTHHDHKHTGAPDREMFWSHPEDRQAQRAEEPKTAEPR